MVVESPVKPITMPGSLVSFLTKKQCVLFAGAGLSKWGNLPKWNELLQSMVDRLQEDNPTATDLGALRRHLINGDFLIVAQQCKDSLGQLGYYEILKEQLGNCGTRIPAPHEIIVKLPFSAVVTTNYDKLLETAYSRVSGIPPTPTHQSWDMFRSLMFGREFFILKAHGDIFQPETIIFTEKDYNKIIDNEAFKMFFSDILEHNILLFIGYSINDPDFKLLLDHQLRLFKGYVQRNYALMKEIDDVTRNLLLENANIQVISYKEQEDVLRFLEALKDAYTRIIA